MALGCISAGRTKERFAAVAESLEFIELHTEKLGMSIIEQASPTENLDEAAPWKREDELSEPASKSSKASTPSKRRKRSKSKKLWTSGMLFVRRIHLYSGIAMFPFVILYGISGWLFNHPRYFTGDRLESFDSSVVASNDSDTLTPPAAMASQIVEEINRQTALEDGPLVELTDRRTPQLSSYFTFSARTDEETHTITMHPLHGHGQVRSTERDEEDDSEEAPSTNPLESISVVEIEDNSFSQAKENVPKILEELGYEDAELLPSRRSPSLIFTAEVDGIPTNFTYSLSSGSLNGLREDSPSEMETKSFLQRLHLTRVYSPQFGTRWVWALMVDVMAISMVFWGASGILMWWQIKRTRWLGAMFFIGTLVVGSLLFASMYDQMTSLARTRRVSQTSSAQKPETEKSAAKSKAEDPPQKTGKAEKPGS